MVHRNSHSRLGWLGTAWGPEGHDGRNPSAGKHASSERKESVGRSRPACEGGRLRKSAATALPQPAEAHPQAPAKCQVAVRRRCLALGTTWRHSCRHRVRPLQRCRPSGDTACRQPRQIFTARAPRAGGSLSSCGGAGGVVRPCLEVAVVVDAVRAAGRVLRAPLAAYHHLQRRCRGPACLKAGRGSPQ